MMSMSINTINKTEALSAEGPKGQVSADTDPLVPEAVLLFYWSPIRSHVEDVGGAVSIQSSQNLSISNFSALNTKPVSSAINLVKIILQGFTVTLTHYPRWSRVSSANEDTCVGADQAGGNSHQVDWEVTRAQDSSLRHARDTFSISLHILLHALMHTPLHPQLHPPLHT